MSLPGLLEQCLYGKVRQYRRQGSHQNVPPIEVPQRDLQPEFVAAFKFSKSSFETLFNELGQNVKSLFHLQFRFQNGKRGFESFV